jgi:hypothetical protein
MAVSKWGRLLDTLGVGDPDRSNTEALWTLLDALIEVLTDEQVEQLTHTIGGRV